MKPAITGAGISLPELLNFYSSLADYSSRCLADILAKILYRLEIHGSSKIYGIKNTFFEKKECWNELNGSCSFKTISAIKKQPRGRQ